MNISKETATAAIFIQNICKVLPHKRVPYPKRPQSS